MSTPYQLSDLSFVGFSQIDGQRDSEIVAKMRYVSHDPFWADGPVTTWAVSVLTYPGEGDQLVRPDVGGLGIFPYYIDGDIQDLSNWTAQGFRCLKSADSTPLLARWILSVNNRDHVYGLLQTYFKPGFQGNWDRAGQPDDNQSFPLTSPNAPLEQITALSETGYPGLPRSRSSPATASDALKMPRAPSIQDGKRGAFSIQRQ